MNLFDYFQNREQVVSVLDSYGISLPDDYSFSDINIVIGKNGSGKTRFLRAINELCSTYKKGKAIYAYFPSLFDHAIDPPKTSLPDCTLSEFYLNEDWAFADFFKEIEAYGVGFIESLQNASSRRQQIRYEEAFNNINRFFFDLTTKSINAKDGNLYVIDSQGKEEELKSALRLLSPGELLLFYMAIFLAFRECGQCDKIIILDEPECHLHPKALLAFINLLRSCRSFEQVWIATHNLFIVSEFEFSNIVYINEGNIAKKNSKLYAAVFEDLLGKSQKKASLLFSSLSQWQYCEFIAECFTDPTVIESVNSKDEQVLMFKTFLSSHSPLHILDYGGGSGRLGMSLESIKNSSSTIDYDIYDIHPRYSGNTFDVFTSLKAIKSHGQAYDCVVMMNFLHEIDPAEWPSIFHDLGDLMSPNAYLVFIEVSYLSRGELPNNVGFLVLNKEELEILFASGKTKPTLSSISIKSDDKSSCVLVPKELLKNINQSTTYKAITHIEQRMHTEIVELRDKNDYDQTELGMQFSRRYAFLLQHYINAKLYCERYRASKRKSSSQSSPVVTITATIESIVSESNRTFQLSESQKELLSVLLKAAKQTGSLSKSMINESWLMVTKLEKGHSSKSLIATLLLLLTVFGDERSKKRLNNNHYYEFLPQQLKNEANTFI